MKHHLPKKGIRYYSSIKKVTIFVFSINNHTYHLLIRYNIPPSEASHTSITSVNPQQPFYQSLLWYFFGVQSLLLQKMSLILQKEEYMVGNDIIFELACIVFSPKIPLTKAYCILLKNILPTIKFISQKKIVYDMVSIGSVIKFSCSFS